MPFILASYGIKPLYLHPNIFFNLTSNSHSFSLSRWGQPSTPHIDVYTVQVFEEPIIHTVSIEISLHFSCIKQQLYELITRYLYVCYKAIFYTSVSASSLVAKAVCPSCQRNSRLLQYFQRAKLIDEKNSSDDMSWHAK